MIDRLWLQERLLFSLLTAFDAWYERFRRGASRSEDVMSVLFQLWVQTENASEALRMIYESKKYNEEILATFKRFFDKDNLKYHCVLAILAACGCVGDDLMDKSPKPEDAGRKISRFIDKLQTVLAHHRDYFNRVYFHAFTVITNRIMHQKGDISDVLQTMFKEVRSMSGAQFKNLHIQLRIQMGIDDRIVETRFWPRAGCAE